MQNGASDAIEGESTGHSSAVETPSAGGAGKSTTVMANILGERSTTAQEAVGTQNTDQGSPQRAVAHEADGSSKSVPHHLWDAAYQKLKSESKNLVLDYEKILSFEMEKLGKS